MRIVFHGENAASFSEGFTTRDLMDAKVLSETLESVARSSIR